MNMRALGKRLSSAATAVYWHVGSRESLTALAADRAWAEVDLPDPAGVGPPSPAGARADRMTRSVYPNVVYDSPWPNANSGTGSTELPGWRSASRGRRYEDGWPPGSLGSSTGSRPGAEQPRDLPQAVADELGQRQRDRAHLALRRGDVAVSGLVADPDAGQLGDLLLQRHPAKQVRDPLRGRPRGVTPDLRRGSYSFLSEPGPQPAHLPVPGTRPLDCRMIIFTERSVVPAPRSRVPPTAAARSVTG